MRLCCVFRKHSYTFESAFFLIYNVIPNIIPDKFKEDCPMFEKKTRVNLTNEEKRLLLHSLVELKNDLIRQGRYTDCVDELIYKIASAKVKKVRSVPAR